MREAPMGSEATPGHCWAKQGRQPSIAIVGAGMSGIAAVVKLREAGYTDLSVYEKADRVGGTWRDNTYPGLSCDVPSHWYCFSFAPNPDWSHRFSYGSEIQEYMEKVADDFGVTEIVRFDSAVTRLEYQAPIWRLTTEDGVEKSYDIVISATGILHHPMYPDIEGLDSFEGACFHSARWDHSVKFSGKRIGVIGTGSTASQIVGEITNDVAEMRVFQRTAQWMMPLPQKRYSRFWKRTLRLFPFVQRLVRRFYVRKFLLTWAAATTGDVKQQQVLSEMSRKNLEGHVADPGLRAKLTPSYQAACKRLVFCSDFYPAITREHAHLITEPIERITPHGVQTADGRHHELDVLVLATGFDPFAFILPTRVTGEKSRDLETFWSGAPRAHRAVALPGFPNFWMLEGPTGPIGNLSIITVTENQLDYIIRMLDEMKARGLAAVSVKEEAFDAYNEALAEALPKTVWVTGGCTSWYMDKTGLPNLYSHAPQRYLEEMQNPDLAEFRLIEEVSEAAATHAA